MTRQTDPAKSRDAQPGAVACKWWNANLSDRTSGAHKALAARLRRASALEALGEKAVHGLAQALGLGPEPLDAERLDRLVRVLAWVRDDQPDQRLARRLGHGETPPMSPLRFQALLRAEGEDLVVALRRALTLAGHRCNVAALADDLYYWNDRARTAWSFDYFGANAPKSLAPAQPATSPQPENQP